MVANVLLLCAESPSPKALGGVQVHVAALARHAPAMARVVTAHLEGRDRLVLETWQPMRRALAEVRFRRAAEPIADDATFGRAIETAIAAAGADVLHLHSLTLGPLAVASAVDRLGIPLVITLHDHALVCEEYRLLEAGRRFCDIPFDRGRCDACLANTRGRPSGSVAAWRSAMRLLADRADAVIAPSRSALDLSARIHPALPQKTTLLPWGVPVPPVQCAPGRDPDAPLRVGVVGVLDSVKGQHLVPDLVAATDDLPLEWHWFGATEGRRLRHARGSHNVTVHGAYAREELARRLQRARIDVVVLPSIVPETFSLTLSEVLAAGLPVVASHLGALGERVTSGNLGWTFDPYDASDLRARLELLVNHRDLLIERAEAIRQIPHFSESDMVREHIALWQRALTHRRAPIEGAWEQARAGVPEAYARAAGRRDTFAIRTIRAIRESNRYRELRLRTILSETKRRSILDRLRRALRG